VTKAYEVKDEWNRLENHVFWDEIGGEKVLVIWERGTNSAGGYRPIVHQPRKWKAPAPDKDGVSPPDAGVPLPEGAKELPPRKVNLVIGPYKGRSGVLTEGNTDEWDIAGRCTAGELKGWTLEPVDAVVCKWFAWSAEYPDTAVHGEPPAKPAKMVAGTAEFLRLLPKPFATVKAVDAKARTVTLLADGETEAKTWPLEPDAEVKVGGWWGRLEQFHPGDRVWAWLKLDRKKAPISVAMLADEVTEFDMHGSLKKAKEKSKFTAEEVEAKRTAQKAWLREQWLSNGLPGTLTFHHVFSGELELSLDHEAMRWGRSLKIGDSVSLRADPPIRAVVKSVAPWRERTVLRLVVGELEAADLKLGQRLALTMTPPSADVEASVYPPDLDRPRTRAERIEWFLASTYCTCGVSKDICTGHFYTLSSCNPNACAAPNARREAVGKLIDRGLTDRQILDELLQDEGPLLLRPHLMP